MVISQGNDTMESGGHEEEPIGRDGQNTWAMHNDNLFDMDEGTGGERYDLSTGRRIDNSTDVELTQLLDSGGHVIEGAPAPEVDDDDAAARWLAANDPDQLVP
jgi:hypothetical protein